MNQNPYTPSGTASSETPSSGSVGWTAMFWLSCVFCLIALGIAFNGCYQYWFYTLQMGIPVAASILAESICVALSGFGLLYSAIAWRRRSMRAGAISFTCSMLGFLLGPTLLRFAL